MPHKTSTIPCQTNRDLFDKTTCYHPNDANNEDSENESYQEI